ncbi:MAG: hypothetical protein PW789_00390 [Edaphobacter sp.]|uniref:hypothetical protein n=1 Tax=Edaphobacter sp. TaxID=1934404 RepID=UPI00238C767B|nr:hypothetical protein [Edaphobacter sp.]MDE1175049.1 hypothetical protein [Edaphobacter sp.]
MTSTRADRKEYIANSILVLIVAASMASLVLKTPSTPLCFLFLATPYVFLISIWWSFRNAYKRFELTVVSAEDRSAKYQYLRSAIQLQTVFGSVGIAVSLAMGFLLGRMGSH